LKTNLPQTIEPFAGLSNQERVSKTPRFAAWDNLLDWIGVVTWFSDKVYSTLFLLSFLG